MSRITCGLLLAVLVVPAPARADEGMWLYSKPPLKYLKDRHGFEPDQKWLDHAQKSSVRFPSGSGSFVSAEGLVMTNHHVAASTIQRLSSKDKDYLKEGFHARKRDEELKCPGLELLCLMKIEDVTGRVTEAVKPDMTPEEAAAARKAIMAKIEQEAEEKTKLQSEVVTLYQGEQFHLYLYKKYTDVRLVFAPEKQIAFFGGDPDNFEFPRYNLDVTFFRCYEENKPAKIDNFFSWSPYGAKENELVFVSGHPGRTSRLNSVADLEYLRDFGLPFRLQTLNRLEVLLSVFSDRSAENRRQATDLLFGVANTRKALHGEMGGLLDPAFMKAKKDAEEKLLAAIRKDDKLKDAADALKKIAELQKLRREIIRPFTALEQNAGFQSDLFGYARTLLRAGDEREKKNAERLAEYRDSGLPSLKNRLLSKKAIYPEYEILRLADWIGFLAQMVGYDNPTVQKLLDGKSPRERAVEVIRGTKLADPEVRKALWEGGKSAVENANDPLLAFVRILDPLARQVRKRVETEYAEVSTQAYAKIAKARYAIEGDSVYPDATFTLRLAFGVVKGYEEDGKQIPFETTFAGLYERAKEHDFKHPFDLPQRWIERKDKLDLKTPFNFVLTADIIGGNSGSPVFNKDSQIVGLIFDGNIQSLIADFAYSDKQGRSVAVHSRGMTEALSKVYDATELVEELTGKK